MPPKKIKFKVVKKLPAKEKPVEKKTAEKKKKIKFKVVKKLNPKEEPESLGKRQTGLTKKEMNNLSPLELFGKLPAELRKKALTSGTKVGSLDKVDKAIKKGILESVKTHSGVGASAASSRSPEDPGRTIKQLRVNKRYSSKFDGRVYYFVEFYGIKHDKITFKFLGVNDRASETFYDNKYVNLKKRKGVYYTNPYRSSTQFKIKLPGSGKKQTTTLKQFYNLILMGSKKQMDRITDHLKDDVLSNVQGFYWDEKKVDRNEELDKLNPQFVDKKI